MLRKILIIGLICFVQQARADAWFYSTTCEDSYSKQGEQTENLEFAKGRPIRCDNVIFALLENGRVSIQIVDKSSNITPLGFTGSGLDYEANPNYVTIHLDSVSLPHKSNPGNPQTVQGIEGFCLVEGSFNIRSLTKFGCVAKIEIGTQKLIYSVTMKVKGIGEKVPGL
jgi:hypothetical protein